MGIILYELLKYLELKNNMIGGKTSGQNPDVSIPTKVGAKSEIDDNETKINKIIKFIKIKKSCHLK